jgi:hypothetical protein
MLRIANFTLLLVALAAPASAAAAAEKMRLMCMYESGQSGDQKISDYAIANTGTVIVPKGTMISFITTGAPGKTFTVKAPQDLAPQDSFSTGGTYPAGGCQAWWTK